MCRRFHALRIATALVAFAFALTPASALAASAGEITSINLSAASVSYFSNRYIVTGDDNVRVSLSDGTVVRGRTFSMDLKSNRFIVAGGVNVHTSTADFDGAAFAMFLDYHRAYFLPFIDQPDRWTFLDGDYAHPAKGREMPGDAFALPDLGTERPFAYAKTARITPKEGVQLKPATVHVVAGYVPGPSYYANFSANSNFAQANSLAGATADVGYPFAGSKNTLSAIHLRYDDQSSGNANSGPYFSVEQQIVGARSYLGVSVNPVTRPQHQYNLVASTMIGSRFQVRTFDQVSAFQHNFAQPLSASGLANVQMRYAFPNSFLQFDATQFYNSLLAEPVPDASGQRFYGDTGHPFSPNHSVNAQLAWLSADRRVNKLPLYYRSRVGMLTAHDGYGLGDFNGTPFVSLWQHFFGGTIYTDAFHFGTHALPLERQPTIQLTYDVARTFYSQPRYTQSSVFSATMSRQFSRKFISVLNYSVGRNGDYLGDLQSKFYPSKVYVSPYDGKTYNGFAAFNGQTIARTVSAQLTFEPTTYFSTTLQLVKSNDFPEPIPFVTGNPPWQFNGRTRFRLTRTIAVDLSRSYYFNYANQRWSPRFGIQIGP